MGTNMETHRPLRRVHSSTIGAVIILTAGIVLLLDQMDVIPLDVLLRYWPLAVIGLGVVQIVLPGQLLQKVAGGLTILFGGVYLARNLGFIHISGNLFWPLVIIAIGVLMLVRAIESQQNPKSSATLSPGMQREVCVFSGCKRINDSQEFRGADLFTMFGGIDIDFSAAKMAGETAEIGTTAMFGGIELRVPQDWVVIPRATCLFGGMEDRTRLRAPGDTAPTKTLIITGLVMFGGVELKN
jgi:predicted membrane protein